MILPKRFQHAHMKELDAEVFGDSVIAYGRKLAKNVEAGRGLCLSGPPGVGKTYAAAALTNRLIDRTVGGAPLIVFETAYTLVERYAPIVPHADTFNTTRDEPWTKTYESAAWLVINDLGKNYRAGKLQEQLVYKVGRLLRTRAEAMLVTHITTNVPLAKRAGVANFSEVFGDSVWSLMAETMYAYEVEGPDRRVGTP